MASRRRAEWLVDEHRYCLNRIDIRKRHDYCHRHRLQRSVARSRAAARANRAPLGLPPASVPAPRAPRDPTQRSSQPHGSRVPDDVYELGYRVCTDGWQKAVAWRLSNALQDAVWARVRKRPNRLCRDLADLAKEVEDAAKVFGEAAGLATVEGLRLLRQSRLVQKIGQTIVRKAVPAVYESETKTLALALRMTGIWACVSDGTPLRRCPCFEALATGHSTEWVEARLNEHLRNLRVTEHARS